MDRRTFVRASVGAVAGTSASDDDQLRGGLTSKSATTSDPVLPLVPVEQAAQPGEKLGIERWLATSNIFRALLNSPSATAGFYGLENTLMFHNKVAAKIDSSTSLRRTYIQFQNHSEEELVGKLDGKVAVISGGTSGIGARTVEVFVNEGARVVIAGRRREAGEALAAKLGTAASFIRTDVSVERDVAAMIQHAVDRFGRLDCLFNNAADTSAAGIGIADIDMQRFNAAMAVHVGGAVLGMKHAAPIMMRQQCGSIINTASVNGTRAGYTTLTYCTAKAAVIHLTKCVAVELGPYGVRVNSLSPGPVITGIFGKAFGIDPDMADGDTEAARSAVGAFVSKVQPLRGMATPDDIAKVVLFLASDASRCITAHDLLVDGGITAGRTQSEMMANFAIFQKELGSEHRSRSTS